MPEEAPIKRVATTRLAALNASTKISALIELHRTTFFATEVTVLCVWKLLVVVVCGFVDYFPKILISWLLIQML